MIDALVDRFPREVITRPELRDMAADASDAESRGGLLVATLMWGRGKRNGRMRDHIINLLKTPSLNGVLAETSARAAAGDPAGAYRSWALPGLREAFFTKWLWAASYIGPTDQHCLVLDSRVWTTLNETFEWSSVVAAGTISRPARYASYVTSCHDWARELDEGVSAEDVEWALFEANGNLAKLHPETTLA